MVTSKISIIKETLKVSLNGNDLSGLELIAFSYNEIDKSLDVYFIFNTNFNKDDRLELIDCTMGYFEGVIGHSGVEINDYKEKELFSIIELNKINANTPLTQLSFS